MISYQICLLIYVQEKLGNIMHMVPNSHIYNQMATEHVLPPVDKHALTCKMVNSSATPAVTSVLYKINSEAIIESETVPVINSEKCGPSHHYLSVMFP